MPEPGDLIGPYRVVSQLGRGAMGEVWRARDERLDRYVALKVLPADAAVDLERRARMLREARAAAAIQHPNVVTLYDIIAHAGDDVLVMELVEGTTVSDALRKNGPPSLEIALSWIIDVTEALVAAHGHGILHRDIKAANIMVSGEAAKVLDFGLAKMRGDVTSAPAPTGPLPASPGKIALDETMASSGEVDSYQTHAGQLLGTPLYMAPEQIAGAPPDERSEVFSVGVLAYEILTGKPPYTATSVDALFRQIVNDPPPPLTAVVDAVETIVLRALAKDPAQRWQSMAALRDAFAAQRTRLFAPRHRRWPIVVAAALLLAGAGTAMLGWRSERAPPGRPGDDYVKRALEEYNVFYNDKALSSLRAALAVAPAHPRAISYVILFGGASEADRNAAVEAARRARPATDEHSKDRALLDAAIAFADRGAAEARRALLGAGAGTDRELAFWAAELDYRAGDHAAARDEYRALLSDPAEEFRGRIYDHQSAVLLYFDEPAEALKIGMLYRNAFPGEADAVAVYATTLAAAGRYDEAITTGEEALRLNEGEDTLAGLAKVLALAGDHARAKELYARSLERAGPSRRPLRRAALGLLQWIDGDTAAALATVQPCLGQGTDARVVERGPCLFVAGVIDPAHAEAVAAQLDAIAAKATPAEPAYGSPASLASLVRARARGFGGACIVDPQRPDMATLPGVAIPASAYQLPLDFYAAYHVPFFATWALCEQAAQLAAGDKPAARTLLRTVAERAPGRTWLLNTLAGYK